MNKIIKTVGLILAGLALTAGTAYAAPHHHGPCRPAPIHRCPPPPPPPPPPRHAHHHHGGHEHPAGGLVAGLVGGIVGGIVGALAH